MAKYSNTIEITSFTESAPDSTNNNKQQKNHKMAKHTQFLTNKQNLLDRFQLQTMPIHHMIQPLEKSNQLH